MGDVIPFNNPCGRTMPAESDEMIKAKAFANYYAAERNSGVDPDTAYQRAGQHIMADWDRLIATMRETMKEPAR